jgi:hypothetical protein
MNLTYDELVRRSNINNSPSKYAHRFPQSQRFTQTQPMFGSYYIDALKIRTTSPP